MALSAGRVALSGISAGLSKGYEYLPDSAKKYVPNTSVIAEKVMPTRFDKFFFDLPMAFAMLLFFLGVFLLAYSSYKGERMDKTNKKWQAGFALTFLGSLGFVLLAVPFGMKLFAKKAIAG